MNIGEQKHDRSFLSTPAHYQNRCNQRDKGLEQVIPLDVYTLDVYKMQFERIGKIRNQND